MDSSVNNDNPYTNAGTINIDSSSTLTNSVGARLNNCDPTTRVGGTLNNAGTLVNNIHGSIELSQLIPYFTRNLLTCTVIPYMLKL